MSPVPQSAYPKGFDGHFYGFQRGNLCHLLQLLHGNGCVGALRAGWLRMDEEVSLCHIRLFSAIFKGP